MPQSPAVKGLAGAIPEDKQMALRDYYHNGAGKGGMMFGEDALPDVAPPSWFQPDPLVVGQPKFAQAAKALVDLDPHTKSHMSHSIITQGPTEASMRQMVRSGLPPDTFSGTTLMGITDLKRSKPYYVGVNPSLSNGDSLDTLVHEVGHVAGYGENGAQQAEKIADVTNSSDTTDLSVDEFMKALQAAGVKTKP